MSVHLLDDVVADLPAEELSLSELSVELLDASERARFDELLATRHYLKNPSVVGQALRYVVTYRGRWVALLVFCSAAFHLKYRELWLEWDVRRLRQRRHLLAQNSRFLVLASSGQWPNLASRCLALVCARLRSDWQAQFGHPVLAVETFVDPQHFRGTCYKAAGWQVLGPTRGHQRNWQDFYTDTKNSKELWVRELGSDGLELLRAPELPPEWLDHQPPLAPPCPVATEELGSLWECFYRLQDPRDPRGVRHQLASILAILALATCAGQKNPHAIWAFAEGLNHGQRRLLRCRPRKGKRGQFDVPCERTFRRLLKELKPESLKNTLVQWMKSQDRRPARVLHADGKVIKNADPAPAQNTNPATPPPADQTPEGEPAPGSEIPAEMQKPKANKALTLVNFITPQQRLVDQIAVPQDTNEEAAVALHLPKMDLAGMILTVDAAHTTKANCRQISQNSLADGLFILKGNQPLALAKAQQALAGDFSPSSQVGGERPWAR